MMNRKKRQMPFGFGQPMMPMGMPPQGFPDPMGGNYEMERIQTEINELRRANSELLKRVTRLENYLGIRGEIANEFDRIL